METYIPVTDADFDSAKELADVINRTTDYVAIITSKGHDQFGVTIREQ